ncbi:hypothetical protein L6452_27604 [Arctium lappa]|uniref:Uncharacterized protein n=1 Tax=Arctium lappa TaxID=4217 RepID=A0ACB8ZWE3_ARCLA|nr:hypothetical protein L6452_27604 [Arctium lappa]
MAEATPFSTSLWINRLVVLVGGRWMVMDGARWWIIDGGEMNRYPFLNSLKTEHHGVEKISIVYLLKSRKGFSLIRNPTRKKTPLKLQSGRFKLLRTRIMDGPSCPVMRNTKRGREHEVSLEASNKKKQQQLHSSSAPSAEPAMGAQRVRTPLVPGSTSDTIEQNVITTKDCTIAATSLETMVNPVEKRGVKAAVTICSPYLNRKTEDMVTNKLHMKTMVAQFSNNLLASVPGVADIASLKTIDMV